MQEVLGVIAVLVVAVMGFWMFKKYKSTPEETKDTSIDLFEVLNDINFAVRCSTTNKEVLTALEDLVDSSATLYDKLLEIDDGNTILGPKFQLVHMVTEHLLPYVNKYIETLTVSDRIDDDEFISSLETIKTDVDKTLRFINDGKLKDFEMNHQFIAIKYN